MKQNIVIRGIPSGREWGLTVTSDDEYFEIIGIIHNKETTSLTNNKNHSQDKPRSTKHDNHTDVNYPDTLRGSNPENFDEGDTICMSDTVKGTVNDTVNNSQSTEGKK